VHAASVITCVTSQNTLSVSAIMPLPREHVLSQLEAVLGDAEVAAAKTGMLYSREIASTVAGRLEPEGLPLVVDPVLAAGVGDSLHVKGLLGALREELIPLATVVTPNRHEAEVLTGKGIKDLADAKRACRGLSDLGPRAVLLKGGHFSGEVVVDLLYCEGELTEIKAPRLDVKPHGSGCNLSSFIAGNLAKGLGVREAVILARSRTQDALASSYAVGQGLRVVDSLAALNREATRYQVLVELRESLDLLLPKLTREWVPEVGMNFVFALPGARYYEDVCGIEGRIVGSGRGAMRCGCLSFGASRHLARVVLAAMRAESCTRAALNLRYSTPNLSQLRRLGLTAASFDRSQEPEGVKTMEWGTLDAIERFGRMPDLVFDQGGMGKEPMIRVLGRDPGDVLRKIQGLWS
jgi:hydroxymethylpyrimidine/phosphomethylpyrimidine kinase